MKLTVKTAASLELPAGKSDWVYFDSDIAGLGLRLRESGTRTWIYRYRVGKKQRSITLGNAKAVPLATARANAGQLEAKVRLGGDPAQDKETARLEADLNFGGLVDEYLDSRKAEWRPNTFREVRRHLFDCAKPLHKTPIALVTQRQVAKLLDGIAQSAGPVSANRLRASLAAFFSWTIQQGVKLPQGNVASFTKPRAEKSRERKLGDDELKAVWQCLPDDDDYGAILKLLILTGSRKSEIGSLRFDEMRDGQINLPPARTKNKRPHTISLSAPAKAILDNFRILGRVHVFGRDDTAGFNGWGICKRRLDERIAKTGVTIAPWRVHDLRRSCASGLQRLGVRMEVIERALNHVSGSFRGVAGVYQRDPMTTEVREALDKWAAHVLALVE